MNRTLDDEATAEASPAATPDGSRRYVIGLSIVAGLFAAMMIWTWRTWPDPIIDFGRELYLAWRVSEGDALYREVEHFNGPLSVHFNALLFKIFGVSLMTLATANILIAAAIAWLIYDLAWRATEKDGYAATAAGVVFGTMFAFAQYVEVGNYNYATPYSHELTHGLLLSLCALAAIARAITPGRSPTKWLFAAGVATGLLLLTKPEPIIAGGIGSFIGAAVVIRRTARVQDAAAFVGPILLIVVVAWTALYVRIGTDATRAILGGFYHAFDERLTSMPFYRRVSGLDDPAANIAVALASAAALSALFLIGWVFHAVPFSRNSGKTRRREAALVAAVLPPATAFAFGPWFPWALAFRGVGWFAIVAMIVTAAAAFRQKPPAAVIRPVLCLFAALLTIKIFFAASGQHYGFALAMPAVLVFVVAITWWRGHDDRESRRGDASAARAWGTASVVVLVAVHLARLRTFVDARTVRVGDGGDAFLALKEGPNAPSRGRALAAFLDSADSVVPKDATLAAVPEGAMINYLLRRENPTPFVTLLPPEFVMFGSDRIVGAYRNSPPDFIVVVPTDVMQYGSAGFANDYGRDSAAWIDANYEPVPIAVNERYPLQLMRRR